MAQLLTDFPASPLLQPAVARAPRRFALPAEEPAPAPAPVAAPQNGVFTDIGHGLAAGAMVDVPKMAGQAMQAFGIAPELGKSIADSAKAREEDPAYKTTGVWGEGARGVAPALATLGVGALAAPLGATAVGVGGAAAAAGLFGGSTYQDVKERALAAGAAPEQAEDTALKAGALMGVGQAAAAHIGGKILAGAGGAIANAVIKKGALANGLLSFTEPSAMKAFGKNFAEMMGVQEVVQPGTAAGMNAIEQSGGIDTKKTNWEAARDSFAPTAAMTTMLSPIGIFGARQTAAHREQIAKTVSGDGAAPDVLATDESKAARVSAIQQMARQLRQVAPKEEVSAWQVEAMKAALAGEPVNLKDPGFNADAARAERAQAQQTADAAQARAAAEAAGTENIDYANVDIPGELPRDVQTTGESVDYANTPLPGDESVTVGNEAGDRRARIVANRAEIKQRIADREALDPSKISVEEQQNPVDVQELPVQEIDVHGVREDRTRSAVPNEEAAQRLAAVQTEEGPAQGTARLLGLPVDSAVQRSTDSTGREQAVKPNTEQKVKALRGELGSAPMDLVRSLAKAEPKDIPEMLRAAWHDRGGEGAKQAYVEKIGTLYEKLTGRKVSETRTIEVPNETVQSRRAAAAKATAEDAARAESERVASAARPEDAARTEQVAQAEGNAAAGTGSEAAKEGGTESPIAAAVVRFGGKEYEGATHIEAIKKAIDDGVPTKTTASGVKVPVLNDGDSINLFRTKEGKVITRDEAGELVGAKRTEDMPPLKPTAKEAADVLARSSEPPGEAVFNHPGDINGLTQSGKEVPSVPQGRRTEASVKAERQGVASGNEKGNGNGERNAKARDVRSTVLSTDPLDIARQKAKDASRAAKLAERRLEQANKAGSQEGLLEAAKAHVAAKEAEKAAIDAHDDLVRRDEKKESGREPMDSPLYWKDAIDPARVREGRWSGALHFVSLKNVLGLASPQERGLLHSRAGDLQGKEINTKVRAAAKTAWQLMTPEERQMWQDRIDSRLASEQMGGKVLGSGVVTKATREERFIQGTFESTADNLERDLQDGRISQQAYDNGIVDAMNKAAESLSNMDSKKRGLAGLDDAALHNAVKSTPIATAAMEHIARTSRNPLVRAVAKVLAYHMPSAKVVVVENPDFNGGRYNPKTHTIEIGRGGMNAVTLMHETVHSLSHAALYRAMQFVNHPNLTGSLKREVQALQTVREVMAGFEKKADLSNFEHVLALKDEHEFLSEALNNPEIQRMLGGKSGLFTKFANAIRSIFNVPIKETEFERLLRTAPDLFGPPNRNIFETFHSNIDRNAPAGSPAGIIRDAKEMGEKLYVASSLHKLDPKVKLREGVLNWSTLNNGAHWLAKRVGVWSEQFQQHRAKLEEARDALAAPWDVLNERAGGAAHLMNAPGESRAMVDTLAHAMQDSPERFKQMSEMARRARQFGFDPRESLADARKRNPGLLAATHASMRAEWDRLKDTKAGEAYAAMRDSYKLSAARYTAARLDQMRVEFGLGHDEDLNWMNHTHVDGRLDGDHARQLRKLETAIDRTKTEVAALTAANKDAKTIKSAVGGYINEYERQRAQPYIHYGRSGDYMLHFEVRPEHYEAVRKIVNEMDRDMGPDTGNRIVDMRFQNELEYNAARAKFDALEKSGAFHIDNTEGEPKSTWAAGRMVDHFMKIEGATPAFIKKLSDRIRENPAYDNQTKEMMVRELVDSHIASMPERNPLKAQMFADLTSGSSKDLIDTFAKRQTMANNALISAQASGRMAEAFSRINAAMKAVRETPELGAVATELASHEKQIKARVADLQESVNTPVVDALRGLAAPWRLGLSAAYMLTNSYQPFQMTLPQLGAKYGFGRSLMAMGRAYGKAFRAVMGLVSGEWNSAKGENLWRRALEASTPGLDFSQIKNKDGTYLFNGHELDLMNHLQKTNIVGFGNINQMWRPQGVGAEVGMNKLQETNRIASAIPHFIELTNRLVAALTAHELAMTEPRTGKAIENPTKAQLDFAKKFAVTTVRDTDGDHSQTNIARRLGRRGVARGVTPLLVGFNQYMFQMTETILRTALGSVSGKEKAQNAKALGGMFLSTGLIAGVLGMPFMGLFTGLYNQLGTLFGDKNDSPPDAEKGIRDALTNMFGEHGGELAARGLPRAVDVDMSARAGYQDLAPFNNFLTDRSKLEDRIKTNALNFLGPGLNIPIGMATGLDKYLHGDMVGAANDALPVFLRNQVKAYRMSEYGYEKEGANERIPLPVSGWNVVAQAAGFTPGAKAALQERQHAFDTNQKIMQDRISTMRNNVLRGMDQGDGAKMGDAMQQLISLAVHNPEYAHAPGGIGSAMTERAQSYALASMMGGVHAKKSQIPWLMSFEGAPGLQ